MLHRRHHLRTILGPLADARGVKTLTRRLEKVIPALTGKKATRPELTELFKANIHDHIDCSVRYETMLELWDKLYKFRFNNFSFPDSILGYWKAVNFSLKDCYFPDAVTDAWRGKWVHPDLKGAAREEALRKSKEEAVRLYREFLLNYGGGSLFQYVQAICVHILPLMQSAENVQRVIKERIEDGVANGECMAELRGAPQLHTWNVLSIEDATRAYVTAIRKSAYPVSITLCALRHEDAKVAWNVAKLAGKYRHQGVRCFDLAADESSNPGVLNWWVKPAVLASLFGLQLTIHMWETNEPTVDDIMWLNSFDLIVPLAKAKLERAGLDADQVNDSKEAEEKIAKLIDEAIAEVMADESKINYSTHKPHLISRLGHGFRGNMQGNRVCEVCFSSNVATHQVARIADHPAHALFKTKALLTINTDGTTLIGITGLLDEYTLLQDNGWDVSDFLIANVIAVSNCSFPKTAKLRMLRRCITSYESFAWGD